MSSSIFGAVHIPGEMIVDSWVYSIPLATDALANGANIYTNFQVNQISRGENGDESLWTVGREDDDKSSEQLPLMLQSKAAVNAAGNWSDLLEISAHGTVDRLSKPRRGQYCMYKSDSHT